MAFESEAKAVQKLGMLKRILANIDNWLKQDNISHHELIVKQNKLPEIWENFTKVREYLECEIDSKLSKKHVDQHTEFENWYDLICAKIQGLIDAYDTRPRSPSNISSVSQNSNQSRTRLKLPPIELPTFKGDLTKYLNFRNTFVSLVINNDCIDDVQRLHYLLSSLQGEPKGLLNNLAICEENFNPAWKLIEERYNNKRLIVSQHIKQLLNLHNCISGVSCDYRKLINEVKSNICAIEGLESETSLHEILLQELILNKINHSHRCEWENQFVSTKIPKLNNLIDFLEKKCQALELSESRKPIVEQGRNLKPKLRTFHVAENNTRLFCKYCNLENHSIVDCRKFKEANVDHRRKFVKENKLCFVCFSASHVSKHCKQRCCPNCNGRHHRLVHRDINQPTFENNNIESAVTSSTAMKIVSGLGANVLLSTARVGVKTNFGKIVTVKALLDSASQLSFITSGLVKKLGLKTNACRLPIVGIGNANMSPVSSTCNVVLHSEVSNYSLKLNCAVVDNITTQLPAQTIDASTWDIPSDIVLSDPTFDQPSTIDILLGADVHYEIVFSDVLRRRGHPALLNTRFGWVLSGSFPESCIRNNSNSRHVKLVKINYLDNILQKFWELEEINQSVLTLEERACEQHFVDNTYRDSTGNFVVKLPIRPECTLVAESKHNAIERLKHIEKKFVRCPELKKDYIEFMREYLELGHMEIATPVCPESLNFYMPHHCVLKDSVTTKLRVVFDGSCKSSNGASLNSMLMVGPTVQPDLLSIVLKFRTYFVALSADIAKMYRCVQLHPDQRDLQRIVWRESPIEEMQEYRLTTVTYGTSSASYLATRCLVQLADEHSQSHPVVSETIRSCFYVDDLLAGANSIEEAKELQLQLTSVLDSAHFHLRKWTSNCSEALVNVPIEDRQIMSPRDLTKDEAVKTLGLVWLPKSDEFQVQIKVQDLPKKITKRKILAIVASIFDPLGLIGCVVVKCKLILQHLWQLKIDWDESLDLSSEIIVTWSAIYNQLPLLNKLKIERKILPFAKTKLVELHGFSDASESAYGACVYVRSVSNSDEISVVLLTSKSRVAPLKQQSIARLELCGALLLSRLMCKVVESLKLSVSFQTFYWTDSTIVLCWLQKPPNAWKTFVANRVSEIQSLTSVTDWRHVSTNCNPADHLSRGVLPSELLSLDSWWNGPTWLHVLYPEYSDFVANETQSAVNSEGKVPLNTLVVKIQEPELKEFSSYCKLKRVYSYVMRFVANCRSDMNTRQIGPLTPDELKIGETKVIKLIQTIEYSKEFNDLKLGKIVASSSKLKSLNPFIGKDSLLRVGGRLANSLLEFDEKHPVILPPKSFVTKLLIISEHRRLLHSGPQAVLFSLRTRFWIPRGRSVVRKVIHSCYECFRCKPTAATYVMGQLPSYRVQPSLPFVSVGIDYGGPIIIRGDNPRSKVKFKSYIALFVCLVTKAIHLELVKGLSTQDFFAAFKRFVARRGLPNLILSDNGLNFVGASNELLKILKSNEVEIQEFASNLNITWKFIPPSSPHFGGIWEAGIKSVKSLLKRTIGKSVLNFEQLSTLLYQIESVLNSRPLCQMTDDPNDDCYLTPGHFLVGRLLVSVPSAASSFTSLSYLTNWKLVQQLYAEFWRKWSKEYLHSLQRRQKWTAAGNWTPSKGDLVLLKEDNIPPLVWKTGIIETLHPGSDNITRVVTVRTKTGLFRRPTVKLCPLPKSIE